MLHRDYRITNAELTQNLKFKGNGELEQASVDWLARRKIKISPSIIHEAGGPPVEHPVGGFSNRTALEEALKAKGIDPSKLHYQNGRLDAASQELLKQRGFRVNELPGTETIPGTPGGPISKEVLDANGFKPLSMHYNGNRPTSLDELRFYFADGKPKIYGDGCYHFKATGVLDPKLAHTRLPAGVELPNSWDQMKVGIMVEFKGKHFVKLVDMDSSGIVKVPKEFFGDGVAPIPRGGSVLPGYKPDGMTFGFLDKTGKFQVISSARGAGSSDFLGTPPITREKMGYVLSEIHNNPPRDSVVYSVLEGGKKVKSGSGGVIVPPVFVGDKLNTLDYGQQKMNRPAAVPTQPIGPTAPTSPAVPTASTGPTAPTPPAVPTAPTGPTQPVAPVLPPIAPPATPTITSAAPSTVSAPIAPVAAPTVAPAVPAAVAATAATVNAIPQAVNTVNQIPDGMEEKPGLEIDQPPIYRNNLERRIEDVPRDKEEIHIADLHGNWKIFYDTMVSCGLIEDNKVTNIDALVWKGKNKRVVFHGDILGDRQEFGLPILQAIRHLRTEARKESGDIIVLSGNHDDFMTALLAGRPAAGNNPAWAVMVESEQGRGGIELIRNFIKDEKYKPPVDCLTVDQYDKFLDKQMRKYDRKYVESLKSIDNNQRLSEKDKKKSKIKLRSKKMEKYIGPHILENMRNDTDGLELLNDMSKMKVAEYTDDTLSIHSEFTPAMVKMIDRYVSKGNSIGEAVDSINEIYMNGMRDQLLMTFSLSDSEKSLFTEIVDTFLDTSNRTLVDEADPVTGQVDNEAIEAMDRLHKKGLNRVVFGHSDREGEKKDINGVQHVALDLSAGKPDPGKIKGSTQIYNPDERSAAIIAKENGRIYMGKAELEQRIAGIAS